MSVQEMYFDPRVSKIPWSRAWQPTPVFLRGEFHGQRGLRVIHSTGSQRVRPDWSDLACMHHLWKFCHVPLIFLFSFCLFAAFGFVLLSEHLPWAPPLNFKDTAFKNKNYVYLSYKNNVIHILSRTINMFKLINTSSHIHF